MKTKTIIKSVGRTGSKLYRLKVLLYYPLLFFLLFIILINAIFLSVEQKSVIPLIEETGGRILLVTNDLKEISMEISTNEKLIDFSNGFWKGLWKAVVTFSELIFTLFIIYYWFKLIYWFFDKLTNVSSIVNIILSIITFFFLQITFILLIMSLNIHSGLGLSDSVIENLQVPFSSFVEFLKIFERLIENLSGQSEKIVGENPFNLSG